MMLENKEIPRHIAIIMDGNGRWALRNSLKKEEGHKRGVVAAEKIAKACMKHGVQYLTLYAFSSENWERPNNEVNHLMHLLHEYLAHKAENLVLEGVRVIFIGDRSKLSANIRQLMNYIEASSVHNKFCLIIAISYGARDEIRNAAITMCKHIIQNKISCDSVSPTDFDNFIGSGVPDPDLLIRTGGEHRVSNFLLWQLAYTELYFSDKLWPDFAEKDLVIAIEDFCARERRYGK